MALQRLMEVVQKGDEMYHGVVLDILKAIFEVGRIAPTFPPAKAPQNVQYIHILSRFGSLI